MSLKDRSLSRSGRAALDLIFEFAIGILGQLPDDVANASSHINAWSEPDFGPVRVAVPFHSNPVMIWLVTYHYFREYFATDTLECEHIRALNSQMRFNSDEA